MIFRREVVQVVVQVQVLIDLFLDGVEVLQLECICLTDDNGRQNRIVEQDQERGAQGQGVEGCLEIEILDLQSDRDHHDKQKIVVEGQQVVL